MNARTASRGGAQIRCADVGQVYRIDGEDVVALQHVELTIAEGESVALFGPSGSGKSTLISLLAGLRRPSSGRVWLGDEELSALSERSLLRARGRQVGVVLQNPSRSLLPYGSAEDNILFAQRPVERAARGALAEPSALLRQLGLDEFAGRRVAKLSGGEQQRLSVAVAMAASPRLLLADEPTSQLDSHNRDLVVELMRRVGEEFGTTIVVVTHDPAVADATRRRITLDEGRVVGNESYRGAR
ncbi:MAG: ABC transporter ATP-binding protein [Jatrophihabitantaceae bacterium]